MDGINVHPLKRRVKVEEALLRHFKNKTSPSPDECIKLALEKGVPTGWGKKKK